MVEKPVGVLEGGSFDTQSYTVPGQMEARIEGYVQRADFRGVRRRSTRADLVREAKNLLEQLREQR